MAKNYYGITDTGIKRNNNEDTFIAETVMNNEYVAACVIDGVGGYSGGEVAAEIARQTIVDHLREKPADIIGKLKDAINTANDKIFKEKKGSGENEQMACVVTLAIADIKNNKFYYAHVGDTRLYLLRDQSLVKVTKDHSFVGFLEDSGRLTEDAAMRHPKRNEINKALGFDGSISANPEYIETGESPFLPGDVLLLCSDGLTDMVSNGDMTKILTVDRNLVDKGKALVNAANDAGGKDNITVVLVHNDKPQAKHEATRPAVSLVHADQEKQNHVTLSGDDHPAQKEVVKKKKETRGTVRLLTFLLILVVLALLWLLYRDYVKQEKYETAVQQTPVSRQRNAAEQSFVDSVDGTANGEVFVLNTAAGAPIILSDSVYVNRDSMHIIGNGVTFKSDTSYNGAAFSVSGSTQYILLDSLTLEGFDVGVLLQSPALHLKNVQFKNCKIPVQYQVKFPENKMISGSLPDSLFSTSFQQNNY